VETHQKISKKTKIDLNQFTEKASFSWLPSAQFARGVVVAGVSPANRIKTLQPASRLAGPQQLHHHFFDRQYACRRISSG
jgi:hypothetical protein